MLTITKPGLDFSGQLTFCSFVLSQLRSGNCSFTGGRGHISSLVSRLPSKCGQQFAGIFSSCSTSVAHCLGSSLLRFVHSPSERVDSSEPITSEVWFEMSPRAAPPGQGDSLRTLFSSHLALRVSQLGPPIGFHQWEELVDSR